jgi:23S rRNA pseudouridine1911/1915/1917 synthase
MFPDYSPPDLLTLPAEYAGMRLDVALAALFPEHSRSRLQSWLRSGVLRTHPPLGGPSSKVRGGEQIQLCHRLPAHDDAPRAQAIALNVIYEDTDLLVINKPPGLVVHPGAGNPDGTLLNGLLHHAPGLNELPRAGIVHRLDKDTSGLLVVAKTLTAQTHLVRQLQARTVGRIYLALACGDLPQGGTVDAPIARHPTQRTKMAIARPGGGRMARTHYKILERLGVATLIECHLETGRTHQIRVHLASIGHPLLGDPVYGRPQRFPVSCSRQALHAWRLSLRHPQDATLMSWESPLPDDLSGVLQELHRDR